MLCTGVLCFQAEHALEALVHDLDHDFLLRVTGVDLQADDKWQGSAESVLTARQSLHGTYVVTNA
jgi:hypothetical protein